MALPHDVEPWGIACAKEYESLQGAGLDAYRNTFEFFTEELNIEVTNRVNLEAKLRHALDHNEFLHHYQPLVRLSDQKIIGVEALVRWQHPTRGLLSPVEFIGLAEDSGLITQLGAWCMRDACAMRASEW